MIAYPYYVYLKYIAFAIVALSFPVVGLVLLKLIQKVSAGRCRSLVCLSGKTVIITGGCSGLGLQTALVLASRGARIILADKKDGKAAKSKIVEKTRNTNVVAKHLDLGCLDSVRKFANDINATEERLDVLINNAGVGTAGNQHTEDGLHVTMQINHFGPFLLTYLLTDLLKKSSPSRIIFVSSAAAFISNLSLDNLNYPQGLSPTLLRTTLIYANSKLCNVIAANGFAERLKDSGVTCNSLHPGLVNSSIYLKSAKFVGLKSLALLFRAVVLFAYGKTVEEGAQTTLQLALSNKLKDVTGKHFWDGRVFPMPPGAWNKKFVDDIWTRTEELVKLRPEEKIKGE
ncbi:retinol dehydrogenase 12-like [Cylas formicarius]|uniref:retinol dehydrogenase 12-like n=1 Tax=Cylas formicarius TaxID=197179 RepID=UPI0029586F78|nr:retinol dehydrogenase 12-like [Cylas formicarius]